VAAAGKAGARPPRRQDGIAPAERSSARVARILLAMRRCSDEAAAIGDRILNRADPCWATRALARPGHRPRFPTRSIAWPCWSAKLVPARANGGDLLSVPEHDSVRRERSANNRLTRVLRHYARIWRFTLAPHSTCGVRVPSKQAPALNMRLRAGAPGKNRTCCLLLRRQALYPVSYRREWFSRRPRAGRFAQFNRASMAVVAPLNVATSRLLTTTRATKTDLCQHASCTGARA
jgi:hypothetical protein